MPDHDELRRFILTCYADIYLPRIDIVHGDDGPLTITLHASDPRQVIGLRGRRIAALQRLLETVTGKDVQVCVLRRVVGPTFGIGDSYS